MRLIFAFAGVAALVLSSCGDDITLGPTQVSVGPLPPTEMALVPAAVPRAYYHVRPDLRMCMWPYCGGYWLSRVDRDQTVCAGGGLARECYVAEMQIDQLGLTPEQAATLYGTLDRAVILGSIEPRKTDFGLAYWTLGATDGWLGVGKNPAVGLTSLVHQQGCVVRVHALNDVDTFDVAAVNLSTVPAPPADIERARELIDDAGLMVTGELAYPTPGWTPTIVATQFYFPLGSIP